MVVESKLIKAYSDEKKYRRKSLTAKNDYDIYRSYAENGVKHFGHSEDCDGEWGINWWVFEIDTDIKKALSNLDIYEYGDRGVWDDNDWDCSGQTLVDAPTIKKTKTRILVTQTWSLDV